MQSFDFITGKPFRKSLESDYREMSQSLNGEAWKSVQVLAGSIVETLLVDYLTASPNSGRKKDPLKMDLAEVIEVCKAEGVLSDRAADLCSVIRSYRNLIHPGRVARLNEPAPNKSSATVASTLVQMIAEEIAEARRKTAGLNAEQILTKIRTDANARLILKHLLNEANEHEKERLILELIPAAHRRVSEYAEEEAWEESRRLAASYRVVFDMAPAEVRRKAVGEFVRVLKQEDGQYVAWFSSAFFKPTDIQYVEPQSEPMVREYIFGRVGAMHSQDTLPLVEGITEFLPITDVERWLNPFVASYVSRGLDSATREAVSDAFTTACFHMPPAFVAEVKAKLQYRLETTTSEERQKRLQQMMDEVTTWSLDFE